jgi:hypothetical protein
MLEWIELYGPIILTALTSLGTGASAIYAIGKVFKLGKKLEKTSVETTEQIKITREGIVEAFKTAFVPTEWKISVSSQIAKQLTDWKNELFAEFDKRETRRDEMAMISLKILSQTKAYDALTKDDQIKTQDLIKLVGEDDCTIDISET